MQYKIVYVVVSTDKDSFLEQFAISAYSLRYYNSDAHIIIVIDDKTNESLKESCRKELLHDVDEVVVIEVPQSYNAKQRSRYIKTNLRNIIEGDYLFVDTDTIITRSLQLINDAPIIVGAVLDSHNTLPHKFTEEQRKVIGKLGAEEKDISYPYWNSGVMFVKDDEKAHRLYTLWHKLWLLCNENGFSYDQLPLAVANYKLNSVIQPMHYSLNVQVNDASLGYILNSTILHFFFTSNVEYGLTNIMYSYINSIYQQVKEEGLTDNVKRKVLLWRICLEGQINLSARHEHSFLYQYLFQRKNAQCVTKLVELECKVIHKIFRK